MARSLVAVSRVGACDLLGQLSGFTGTYSFIGNHDDYLRQNPNIILGRPCETRRWKFLFGWVNLATCFWVVIIEPIGRRRFPLDTFIHIFFIILMDFLPLMAM